MDENIYKQGPEMFFLRTGFLLKDSNCSIDILIHDVVRNNDRYGTYVMTKTTDYCAAKTFYDRASAEAFIKDMHIDPKTEIISKTPYLIQ